MNLPLLPTISTFFIVLSAVLVAIGWNLILKRRIEAHKKVMLGAGAAALTFFIIYVSRTLFVGNTAFGGPDELKIYYTVFLIFHITLATIGAVMGLVTIYWGLKTASTNTARSAHSQALCGFSLRSQELLFIYCFMYSTKADTRLQFSKRF